MKRALVLLPSLLLPLAWSLEPSSAAAQGPVTVGGGASAQATLPAAAPLPAPPVASPPPASPMGSMGSMAPSPAAATAPAVAPAPRLVLAPAPAPAAPVEVSPPTPEEEWAERDSKMNEAATLTGGVGFVHTQNAQGGAVGQFRVGFATEYFSAGFLCTNKFSCPDPKNAGGTIRSDSSDHIGGRLTLSVQVLKWLEPYMATSAYANSNAANRPSLLQVLGDTTLGAKAYGSLGKVVHLGGAFELWLVNGTGSVGLSGAGTGMKFRGLGTIDLRGLEKPVPLRFSLNTTYTLDNGGKVVEETEKTRGAPITRIERFGLGINRTDHFDIGMGGEVFAAQETIRPFVEYTIALPVNRQGYRCRPNNPSGDLCLANEPLTPSSITLGSRFFPWKRGFNLLLALDVGVSGVSTFIEEMKPEAPWMLYLGAGWAFDSQDRPPVVRERVVERLVGKPPGRKIRGFVHEDGKPDAVPGAIVSWDDRPELTSLVTFPDGHFTTHDLDEGRYVFGIKAEGYVPGKCTALVPRPAAGQPLPGQPPPGQPLPGQPLPGQPPQTPLAQGGDVMVDCSLVALPRVGTVVGRVRDADTQAPVSDVVVRLIDAAGKENSVAPDQSGAFRFPDQAPGDARISVDAEGYLAFADKVGVKVRQDNDVDVVIKKRPKNANVTLGKNEIVIKQQVQFAVDSATILSQSNALLTEIADVLIKNPRVKRVEVQGHTDNTGSPDHNMRLSNDRAASVAAWLAAHGVAADRLTAVGYGQTKPLVPNVTAGNRTKNRRVQFIILE